MRYRQNREIAWRRIEGEAILFDTVAGMMRQLNRAGGELWEALEEERETGDLVHLLCAAFDVDPGRARTDVETFLEAMVARGLVESIA